VRAGVGDVENRGAIDGDSDLVEVMGDQATDQPRRGRRIFRREFGADPPGGGIGEPVRRP
jgi:hypothetical protein